MTDKKPHGVGYSAESDVVYRAQVGPAPRAQAVFGLMSHTFDISQVTSSATAQPKITCATFSIPRSIPARADCCVNADAMMMAAVIGAWRHIVFTRTR